MNNPIPGLEVCELKGAAAEAVIREANGGKVEELSLVPMQEDEFHEKLVRAGLAEPSERSKHRAELNR